MCDANTKETTLVIHLFAAPSSRTSLSGSILRTILTCAVALVIAGCGAGGAKYDKTANWSAEQLYTDAKA